MGGVRLGVELSGLNGDDLLAEAVLAEELGYDLVWVDTIAVAAALAERLRAITVGVVVDDPLGSLDEAAALDRHLAGRLVWCLRSPGAPDVVDTFLAGLTQLEPTVWIAGDAALAAERGLTYMASDADDAAASWPGIEALLGRRALRLRRPARWPVKASVGDNIEGLDVHAMADALSGAQRAWGLDTAILAFENGDRRVLMERIAHDVRPRVQLDRLPPGLSDYWDGRMALRLAAASTTHAPGGDDG
jgi:hypothetical protein